MLSLCPSRRFDIFQRDKRYAYDITIVFINYMYSVTRGLYGLKYYYRNVHC